MATLDQDLAEWAGELFTKGDLKAGLKLVAEIAGGVGLFVGGMALVTNAVPILNSIGIPLTIGAANMLLRQAARQYMYLGTEERKQVRAVASFVKGGFNLSRFLD